MTTQTLAASRNSGSLFVRYGPIVALVIIGWLSADTNLFLFGTAIFFFFYRAFFSIDVPPIMLLLFFFQWFFNQGQLFYVLIDGGRTLESAFTPGKSISTVYYLGMIGTGCFFLGALLFFKKIPKISFESIRRLALEIDVDRAMFAYLATYPLIGVSILSMIFLPEVSQPLLMLMSFRWSIFFIFFIAALAQRRNQIPLIAIVLTEFILGFTSFWATFKDVVYVSALAYWVFYFRETFLLRWVFPVVIVFMVYVGIIWTAVKQDYRDFLNGNSGAQISRVDRVQAFEKFGDLASTLSNQDLESGFDALILRMSWIGAFNKVYNNVPNRVPHQDGKLWGEALLRPITPRVLFPDKKVLLDSQELNFYSGLDVDERNTSISLSTIAGSYVDFGPYWMHLPLFLFGCLFGYVYLTVFKMARNPYVGHALSVPLIFLVNVNEQSVSRMVSSLILYWLVVWVVCRFIQSPLLRFISHGRQRR